MWAEFVGSLLREVFLRVLQFSPLPKNQHFSHTAPQAYSFKIVTVYKVYLPLPFTKWQTIQLRNRQKQLKYNLTFAFI